MTAAQSSSRLRRLAGRVTAVAAVVALTVTGSPTAAGADAFVPVGGAGSTWAFNAVDMWRVSAQQQGLTVNYFPTGSADGRQRFGAGTSDFAVSDLPYGLTGSDGTVDTPPLRQFTYTPFVAGGTAIAYNLRVGGEQIRTLRLSGQVLAKLLTGGITTWDSPEIRADNPGLALPAIPVTPVVPVEVTATTLLFTSWLRSRHPAVWDAYCVRVGRPTPCPATTVFPVVPGSGFVALTGSVSISSYLRQEPGSIAFVPYSYALGANLATAKIANAAGYYVAPDSGNVAIGLTEARIDGTNQVADLSGVFTNPDPRAYPLSSYNYLIVPTAVNGTFTADHGRTLAGFAGYGLCEGQRNASVLGYSPLPFNLASAGLDRLRRIPGADTAALDIAACTNPTFSSDGTNLLLANTPMPDPCDRVGTICAPAPSAPATETIQTTVLPGTLTITVSDAAVLLPTMTLNADASLFVSTGALHPITVTDTRAGNPGWTVSGQSSDFTGSGGSSIAAANLGWSPLLIGKASAQVIVMGAVVSAADGIEPGAVAPVGLGLAEARTLASASQLAGNGTAVVSAGLTLRAPTSTPAGSYTATLTFTVI